MALVFVVLAPVGCAGDPTVPAGPARADSTPTAPTDGSSPAPESGYEISDVRLVTVRDPVIFWQVSFDARWTGSGAAEATRCRWRMLGIDGVAIISGGIGLERSAVDDEIAASVYPDEIPGVPKSARVECR